MLELDDARSFPKIQRYFIIFFNFQAHNRYRNADIGLISETYPNKGMLKVLLHLNCDVAVQTNIQEVNEADFESYYYDCDHQVYSPSLYGDIKSRAQASFDVNDLF